MNPLAPPRLPRRPMQGFTLIELLVGLLIAMVGVVVMMQQFQTYETRARTTTSGNDALTGGMIALHGLQRDLSRAGYGMNSLSLLGCVVSLPSGITMTLAPLLINPPVALVPAGDASTDTMLVAYGNSSQQPEGNPVFFQSGNDYSVQAPTAYAVNDYVVGLPAACSGTLPMGRVTAIGATTVTVTSVTPASATLYNLGAAPRFVGYAIRGGALTACDFMTTDCRTADASRWPSISGNIVSLRAQYGRDTATAGAMDGIADLYDNTTPTNRCEYARVPAVRLALVARSAQYETRIDPSTGQRSCDPVTAAAPTWVGSTADNPTGSAARAVNLSSLADWQCYRYRVFEGVSPIRNVVWMGSQSGC